MVVSPKKKIADDVKYQSASVFLINRFDSVSLWSKASRAQAREFIWV
jgi:hypothetical protein